VQAKYVSWGDTMPRQARLDAAGTVHDIVRGIRLYGSLAWHGAQACGLLDFTCLWRIPNS
jgi:hypothetical protein